MVFALAAIPLFGAIGIAIDYGKAHGARGALQHAADSAALAGASLVAVSDSERKKVAEEFFSANVLEITDVPTPMVTIDNNEISVSASYSSSNYFMGILAINSTDVAVSATAVWSVTVGDGCVYALDPAATKASLKFNDMDSVELHTCVPVANSTHDKAIIINDLDSFNAGGLFTAGNYKAGEIDHFDLDTPPLTQQSPLPDPYADIPDPSPGSCGPPLNISGSSATISPGVYCGGLTATDLNSLILQPGTYYIVDGDLRLQNIDSVSCNCTASGSGVTFVLTGTTPAQTGTFTLSDISSVSLRAPSANSYDFPGMLLYVDRGAPFDTSRFHGNGGLTLNGAIYTAAQKLEFSDSDYTAQTDCAQTIAFHVEYTDMDAFGRSDNCAAYGTRTLSVVTGGNIRLIR